tara:strand:+ start:656 stop:976 length:321 start_codon:yes stop_codon:yes gene_type:complete
LNSFNEPAILINQQNIVFRRKTHDMKTFLIYSLLTALNFMLSFFIYNHSFNVQATPYLSEEQRLDSGLSMLATTLPAYLVTSIILSFIFYCVAKNTEGSANLDTAS